MPALSHIFWTVVIITLVLGLWVGRSDRRIFMGGLLLVLIILLGLKVFA